MDALPSLLKLPISATCGFNPICDSDIGSPGGGAAGGGGLLSTLFASSGGRTSERRRPPGGTSLPQSGFDVAKITGSSEGVPSTPKSLLFWRRALKARAMGSSSRATAPGAVPLENGPFSKTSVPVISSVGGEWFSGDQIGAGGIRAYASL